MTMFLVSSIWLPPSSDVTSTRPAPAILPVPWKVSTLFFLSRKLDALGVAVDAALLEPLHLRQIELRRADLDAEVGEVLRGLLERLGGVQQRLRRDAADVEAGAAMGRALLDDGGAQAELRGADGADIAAGAGADDDEIVGAHGSVRSCIRVRRPPGRIAGGVIRSRGLPTARDVEDGAGGVGRLVGRGATVPGRRSPRRCRRRFIGTVGPRAAALSGVPPLAWISVSMMPGATALTRIPLARDLAGQPDGEAVDRPLRGGVVDELPGSAQPRRDRRDVDDRAAAARRQGSTSAAPPLGRRGRCRRRWSPSSGAGARRSSPKPVLDDRRRPRC